MKLLFVSARSATVLLDGSGDYSLPVPVSLSLNGADLGVEKRSVISLFGLHPDSEYTLSMRQGQAGEQMTFRTEPESFTLDVRRLVPRATASRMIHPPCRRRSAAVPSAAGSCCPRGGTCPVPFSLRAI